MSITNDNSGARSASASAAVPFVKFLDSFAINPDEVALAVCASPRIVMSFAWKSANAFCLLEHTHRSLLCLAGYQLFFDLEKHQDGS